MLEILWSLTDSCESRVLRASVYHLVIRNRGSLVLALFRIFDDVYPLLLCSLVTFGTNGDNQRLDSQITLTFRTET
ncbi:Olfactory receptor [Trichinella spiralis]|uniref:Olfactory receptor n=1 Tax=Trichinella spiralis TaxID=6334 RepID=A0ABR3KNL7_TRISP